MLPSESGRVGYVVKRYPRYSETFIVNEILAHEAAGLELEIFSLRPPNDDHFQNSISQVRAPATYIPYEGLKASEMWRAIGAASATMPGFCEALPIARDEGALDVYQAIYLAQQARLKGITHLHAHFGSVATTVARLASHFAGIPYTFTAHAKDIFHASVDHEDLRRKLADAAATITVSEYNLQYLQETYGPDADRVRRIYNGLNLQTFPAAPTESETESGNLQCAIRNIVSVGRLVEKKGFGDLIDACALLTQQGCSFKCLIVGTGELEADLRAQIERLGLGEWVEMAGPRPQNEVIRLVQSADVFVAPCVVGEDGNRDGLPTVLLEAMALGTPCVSTDVTGIPEVVRHEETGLIAPQHDPPALASAIARLLDSPALGKKLADNARQLIESEFDIHSNTAQLRELFGRRVTKDDSSLRSSKEDDG